MSSRPKPAATTTVAARCPESMPLIAGTTERFRRPEEMAYAQSAPGVNTNSMDTAQNAATEVSGMTEML